MYIISYLKTKNNFLSVLILLIEVSNSTKFSEFEQLFIIIKYIYNDTIPNLLI